MNVPRALGITTRPPTILLVDDDAVLLDLLRLVFEHEGMTIVRATTGAQALQRVAQARIDLVVLDLQLPDMSGYDVCARLRRPHRARLPILMLTALGQQNQLRRGLELGADDYLVKPFDLHDLVRRVTRLLAGTEAALPGERACST